MKRVPPKTSTFITAPRCCRWAVTGAIGAPPCGRRTVAAGRRLGILQRVAAEHGVDALVVSNHGGRQLDSAPSTISVLPEVVEAVEGRCEVLFDGGVQSGQDVLKALALGAHGCLIGKAFLYALAAGGESGVVQALEILRKELEVSMALSGCTDARKIDASILRGTRWQ